MDLAFAAEHKTKSVFDADQFRLKKGEKARILVLDEKAKMSFAHYIRDRVDDRTGEARGRYYACIGKYETVMQNGTDPQTCPACKAASPGRDVAVSTPRRRFALHIARYRTNQAGQAITPLSLAMQIWVFSDDKFNKLVDRYAEHGDLRRRDLVITCTAEQYQTFDIDVSVKMLAATDDASKAQYRECKSQMSNDIERLLATPTSYEALERLLGNATPDIMPDLDPSSMDELISEAATAGNGIGGAVSTGAQNGNTAMFDLPAESHEEISGLDDLLN